MWLILLPNQTTVWISAGHLNCLQEISVEICDFSVECFSLCFRGLRNTNWIWDECLLLVQIFILSRDIHHWMIESSILYIHLNLFNWSWIFINLQAMDRAHRLGQKKVVNVHRLIMRGTLEEKVMSLQKFKLSVANAVINAENASMKTMNTDQLLDLFASAETSSKKVLVCSSLS